MSRTSGYTEAELDEIVSRLQRAASNVAINRGGLAQQLLDLFAAVGHAAESKFDIAFNRHVRGAEFRGVFGRPPADDDELARERHRIVPTGMAATKAALYR